MIVKENARGPTGAPAAVRIPRARDTVTVSPPENGVEGLKITVLESSERTVSPMCLPLTLPVTVRADVPVTVASSISAPGRRMMFVSLETRDEPGKGEIY